MKTPTRESLAKRLEKVARKIVYECPLEDPVNRQGGAYLFNEYFRELELIVKHLDNIKKKEFSQ